MLGGGTGQVLDARIQQEGGAVLKLSQKQIDDLTLWIYMIQNQLERFKAFLEGLKEEAGS